MTEQESNSKIPKGWMPVLIDPPGAFEPMKAWTDFLAEMEKGAKEHPE